MTRLERGLLAAILLFAAVNFFWGISSGIPSRERLQIELGGEEVIEDNLPEIQAYLRGESYFRNEGQEISPEQSRLSPFFDLLRSYHSDEQFTLKTISVMVARRTLEPGFYVYGQFYHYQIAAALAAGAVSGYLPLKMDTVTGMRNPDLAGRLYLCGRTLLALMALGSIVLLFFTVRILSGHTAPALISAALLATLPYFAISAKVIKTEMPACFWMLAMLLFAALAYRTGKLRYYLLSGMMIGLAVGSKYTAVFYCIILAGFFLSRNWPSTGGIKPFLARPETRKEFLALCGAGAVSFLTFSIVCFGWITDHATFMSDVLGTAGLSSDRNKFLAFFDYLGCFFIDGALFHMGPLLIILFAAAFCFAAIRLRRETWSFLPVIFLYFLLAASSAVPSSDRYTLPALPLLCILSAALLMQIPGKKVRYGLLGAVLLTSAWYSIAFDIASSRKNVRLTATEQIQSIIPPGTAVGRTLYPVSYRTAMLPFGKYKEYNAEEHPDKIAECRFFIDCSYAYRTEGDSYLRRRLNWLFGKQEISPALPPSFQPTGSHIITDAPYTLGRLLSAPRYFTMDSYLEAISPVIILYF